MSVRVTVEGMPRLRAALLALSGEAERAARREVKRAAVAVEGGAKQRCPVDTGRLRSSITHQVDADGLGAVVGTNVSYAPFVEFGTRRMAAQPFLFPALESHRPEFIRRISEALGEAFIR